MARLTKKSLSYFPFDTDFFSKMSTRILMRTCGCTGVVLYLYVLCSIYEEEGYYVSIDEIFEKYICSEFKMTESEFERIIDFCTEIELFDKKLWNGKKILTSHYIQEVYQRAKQSMRRKVPLDVDREIWLIHPSKTLEFIVVEEK